MTRAEFIKEVVKQLWGVPLDDRTIRETFFKFEGCDGLNCPDSCRVENGDYHCDKCPLVDFWEKEV